MLRNHSTPWSPTPWSPTPWSLFAAGLSAALLLSSSAFAADPGMGSPKMAKGTASKPSDAQIAAIVMAANTGEINTANLAQTKSTNDQVKAFAADMIKDHTAMNDQATALATKLNMTPEDNVTSTHLKTMGDKTMAKLQGLTGTAFDKAYVDSAVMDHKQVLAMIDKTLLPNAKNGELKAMLKSARPTIAQHLQHSQQLQASMKKGSRTMGRTP
jgi:putative membrane protein